MDKELEELERQKELERLKAVEELEQFLAIKYSKVPLYTGKIPRSPKCSLDYVINTKEKALEFKRQMDALSTKKHTITK